MFSDTKTWIEEGRKRDETNIGNKFQGRWNMYTKYAILFILNYLKATWISGKTNWLRWWVCLPRLLHVQYSIYKMNFRKNVISILCQNGGPMVSFHIPSTTVSFLKNSEVISCILECEPFQALPLIETGSTKQLLILEKQRTVV